MKKSSGSYDKTADKNKSDIKMRNLQNDTDLLLDENTEMLSVLNDLGELEDLTELYGDKDDII
jgi:predicted ATPase